MNVFNKRAYVWEVRDACLRERRKYTSKRISQILNYLVIKKKLEKKKMPIKLKNGSYGTRMVYTFIKPHIENK